jgi:taurine dioxygenase
MVLQIERLSDALGAEVRGLDLARPLDGATRGTLADALGEHHLLCLRSAPLSSSDFATLARCFGEPQMQLIRSRQDARAPEVSIHVSTYKTPENKPADLGTVRLSGWHTDDSYFAEPAKGTLLQSLALPESGGETRFCNTEKACEDLPEDMKRRLNGARAVHRYATGRATASPPPLTEAEAAAVPEVTHPIVRTHDETGRKAIFLNPNRTDSVVGLGRAESDALLDEIEAHMTQAKYRYDHPWRMGDILVWDNRCLVHSVNVDYPVGQERRHQRILLKGTRPV